MIRSFVPVALAATLAAASFASAEPKSTTSDQSGPTVVAGKRLTVVTPVEAYAPQNAAATISPTLYLERCIGGCVVHGGSINDARTMTSSIPNPGDYNVTEFENATQQTGTAADAEWGMFVDCMKEVYSPFMVSVTDQKPAPGVSYHLALVAGNPPEVGLGNDILGIAPLAGNCAAFDNVISFSFANAHRQTDPMDRALNLCWTAAQESAHAFGLDHEYSFLDGRSACNDPMTYRFDCGGEKFFRNDTAKCGETEERACRCGATQNSHLKILSVFGPGTSIVPAPTSLVTTPAASSEAASSLPATVISSAFSKRGVAKVELYLNGFKWAEAKGGAFGRNGQPASAYGLTLPPGVPDSVYDVVARAYDDLGTFTDSAKVTVTKGAAGGCASAEACLAGQKCEAGKCFWDAPIGEVGDACTFPQFCKTGQCQGTADQQICTQSCIPGVSDSCPAGEGLICVAQGQGQGICFFGEEGGGCCSTSNGNGWVPGGLAAFALGLVVFGRRRRCCR
ncbi:MAG: hypothetical protein H6Q90_2162 [Deltaproteobacteria bacterium]|nr:hypothetical protein [Deltaproteobacteria bacterium]